MLNPHRIAMATVGQNAHVFPLRPRDKVTLANCDRCCPRTASCRAPGSTCSCWPSNPCHGFRAATTEAAVVDRWWRRWPRANVGISPGPTGHVVIDLDTKDSQAPATLLPSVLGLDTVTATTGVDLFATVVRRLGGVDRLDTRITRTPSGGLHVWFHAPAGMVISSSRGTIHPDGHVTGLGWQIDVRAHGGYVVAPGSVTRNGAYQVVRGCAPMPLPDWLITWLQHDNPAAGPHDQVSKPPCPASGFRHLGRVGASPSPEHRAARAALADECAHITQLSDGRKAALNKAAYKLGGYVAVGYLTADDVRHGLTAAAHAAGVTRITAAIEPGLTAGMARPRYLRPRYQHDHE